MNNLKEVGSYRLAEKLGEGSYGKVYKGIHFETKEEVALKFINKKFTKKNDLDAILAENEILKKIVHENIIRFIDYIDTPTDLVIVMDYAGANLSQVCEKNKKFTLEEIKNYSQQIFQAMWYLYENRIAHRDLKPQNILLKNGIIKLCDFGFAKQLSASTKFMNSLRGTPLYIAPEIINHERYTDKVDIWSFGIIIYELFCGKPPFYDNTVERVMNKIRHLKVRYPPTMPNQLKQILTGMLQKNPLTRFSWQQLRKYSFFVKPKPLSEIKSSNSQKENEVLKKLEEPENLKKKSSEFYEPEEEPVDANQQICHLRKQDNILEDLKKLEKDVKSGKIDGKKVKADEEVLSKVMSVLRSYLAKQGIVQKQNLQTVYSLMSYLVTKVKLTTAEEIQKDITKDKQFLFAVIKNAEQNTDPATLANQFVLIGFLIKNNFESLSIDFDTDQDIVNLCVKQIKESRSKDCFNHSLRVLGILANQGMTTLNNSKQFFFRIESNQVLKFVAESFEPKQQKSLIIECLEKFFHPNINMPNKIENKSQLRQSFRKMKQNVGEILATRNFFAQSPIKIYHHSQLWESYAKICYECLKYSDKFRKQFIKHSFWVQFVNYKSLRIFSLAFDHLCIQNQNIPLLPNDVVHDKFIQCSTSGKMQNVFLIARAAFNLAKKQTSLKKVEHAQSLLLQIYQLLALDEDIKNKACRQVEGFLCYGDRIFQNILGQTFYKILSDPLLTIESIDEGIILSIFKKLLYFKHPHQELRISLDVAAKTIILRQELFKVDVNSMRQDKQNTEILYNIFNYLIEVGAFMKLKNQNTTLCVKKLLVAFFNFMKFYSFVDQKGQISLYRKAYDQELHTLIFSDQIIDVKTLHFGLYYLLKISSDNKCTEDVTDILALALPKIQKFLEVEVSEPELTIAIIQVSNLLIRKNQLYSENLKKFGIISHLPRYLESDNEAIISQSLTLIGNLAKHSVFFFDQFAKVSIFRSMRQSLKNMGYGNKNRVIKGVVFAIGNISFYNDRFFLEIKPLVSSLAAAIHSDQTNFASNALSTISNLLRHSDIYVQCLVEHKIIKSVIEIVLKSNSHNELNLALNLLKKALNHPKTLNYHKKQEFVNICNKKSEIIGEEHDFIKKVKSL